MRELHDLLGRLADGEPPSERLKEILAADPAARRAYREYLNLHVALKSYGAIPELAAPRAFPWRPLLGTAAAAAVLLALLFAPSAPELARLTKAASARWGQGRPSLRAGSDVHLVFGYAELTLSNRVRLVLEAPVRLRLESERRVRLESGRVVADVPPDARGFTIDTPPARVVDLGTEFGVGVGEDGRTDVQVFRGEVVAEWKGARERIEAGQAMRMDAAAAPRGIEFQSDRFTRLFPTDDDGGQPAGPQYNLPRLDAAAVLPAPAGMAIDGDLSDWNRSAAFVGACRPPFHESHALEGLLMYDERFLYVAAHVRDPAPMRSASPQQPWRGGAVILRLGPPGWPLEAKGPPLADAKHPEIGRRPVDVDDRITHLTFWYHPPTAAPRLHLSYGMDFHGEVAEPAGWTGVFRARSDGLGYTLEYRVPWSLLHTEARPPRAGDVLPSTWTVHWSDHEGTLSRGHLVEITNLDELPFRFLRGRCWGKAIFR
ncbi:MAG TPA: FecR domain-containing protein [Planctomycetota bacterium]